MDLSGKIHVGSNDLSTGTLCDPCKGVEEEENAVCYCTVCNEFLCVICTRSHKRAKISKHHQLLDRDSLPKQKFMSSEESICIKHNGKLVEYYCKIHGDCCCSVCATIEHKQCQVEYIDDIATEFEKSKEYTSLISVIADLNQQLHITKTISLKKKADLGLIHVKFVSDVKTFRAEINEILDSLEERTLMQAHTVRDNDSKSTESVPTTCDAMIADLEKMSINLETQKKYKQHRQLLISVKNAQTQIKQYDRITAELNNLCTIRENCFRPNETIIQFIKSVDSLGQVDVRKQEEGLTQLDKKGMELERVFTPRRSVTFQSSLALNSLGHLDFRKQETELTQFEIQRKKEETVPPRSRYQGRGRVGSPLYD